eukprot:gene2835-biopygen1935
MVNATASLLGSSFLAPLEKCGGDQGTGVDTQPSARLPTAATSLGAGMLVGWAGLDWAGLDCTGLDWTGLSWAGLDWTSLDWTGLGWAGPDWLVICFCSAGCRFCFCSAGCRFCFCSAGFRFRFCSDGFRSYFRHRYGCACDSGCCYGCGAYRG